MKLLLLLALVLTGCALEAPEKAIDGHLAIEVCERTAYCNGLLEDGTFGHRHGMCLGAQVVRRKIIDGVDQIVERGECK